MSVFIETEKINRWASGKSGQDQNRETEHNEDFAWRKKGDHTFYAGRITKPEDSLSKQTPEVNPVIYCNPQIEI